MIHYIILIWLFLGIIGWWFTYHSIRKDWYLDMGFNYEDAYFHEGLDLLKTIGLFIIMLGPITFIFTTCFLPKHSWTFYFKKQ